MEPLRKTLLQMTALLLLGAGACRAGADEIEAVLDWADRFVVSFPLDGSVSRVHVHAGDRVPRGARLVELDAEPIAIRVDRYRAEVAAGKPVLADAKREFEHAQSLYEQTVLSDVELQRARHAFDRATAELAASRARLEYALWQQRQATVTAPYDARVVARDVERGQMLVAEQRSRPLLVLARLDRMTARAQLPLSSVQKLETGQALTVVVDTRTYTATVSSLGVQADAADRSGYLLEADFQAQPGDVLWAGQKAFIRLP